MNNDRFLDVKQNLKEYIKITHRQGYGLLSNYIDKYIVYIMYDNELIGVKTIGDGDIKLEKEIELLEDGLEELKYSTEIIYYLSLPQYDLYVNKNEEVLSGFIEKYYK
jgi:hypothetical protein